MKKRVFILLLCFMTFISLFSVVIAATDFTAPKVLTLSPSSNMKVNPVTLQVDTDEPAICKYDTSDVFYEVMQNTIAENLSYVHKKDVFFSEGNYIFYVRCKDLANNTMSYSEILSFSFDTKPPIIVNSSTYNETNTDSYVLKIQTNEPATCRISQDNRSYHEMGLFTYTGKDNSSGLLFHNHLLSGLVQGYSFFSVKCSDPAGNAMTLPFSVAINNLGYLTADITLETSILTPGIHKVTLKTNVPLKEKPTLSYSYDNKNFNDLIVNGKGSEWIAYIEIEATLGVKKGNFKYSGTDIYGFQTNYINSGSSFSVDTTIPQQITDVIVKRDSKGKVHLAWSKKDDDIKYYEIYRAENTTITLLDELATVYETEYVDASVVPANVYYYIFRAVDSADNKGKFTDIIKVGAIDISFSTTSSSSSTTSSVAASETVSTPLGEETIEGETTEKTILPSTMDEFKQLQQKIANDILQSDIKKDDLRTQVPLEVIEKMDIYKLFVEQKLSLKDIKTEMEKLQLNNFNTVELKVKIKEYEERRTILLDIIPAKLFISVEKTVENTVSAGDIDSALQELAKDYTIDQKKMRYSFEQNKEKVALKTQLKEVGITYNNGTTFKKLLVIKEFTVAQFDKVKTYYAVEIIPKAVVSNISNKLKQTALPDYSVLYDDPVITYKLKFDTDKIQLSYIIDDPQQLTAENEFKLFFSDMVLPKQKNKNAKNLTVESSSDGLGSFLTGFSVKSGKLIDARLELIDYIIYGMLLFVIVGFVAYNHSSKSRRRMQQNSLDRQITDKQMYDKQSGKQADKQLHQNKSKMNELLGKKNIHIDDLKEVSGVKKFFQKIIPKNKQEEFQSSGMVVRNFQQSNQQSNNYSSLNQQNDDFKQTSEQNDDLKQALQNDDLFKIIECDSLILANQQYSKLGLKTLNNIHLLNLLDQAHTAINNLDFEKANTVYHLLLDTHAKNVFKLNQEDNVKFKNGLNKLCLKLNIYQNLWYANVVSKKNDVKSLRTYLNKIAEDFNRLTKREEFDEHGTKLLNLAMNSHSKYAEILVNK